MIIARSEYIVACPGRCNRHNTVTITNACVDVVGVGNCVLIRGQGRRSIFEVDRDAGLLGCAVIHKAFAAIQRDIQINGLLRNGEVCGTGVDRVEGFAGHCDDVVTGIRGLVAAGAVGGAIIRGACVLNGRFGDAIHSVVGRVRQRFTVGARWLREVPKRCAPLRRYSDCHGVIARHIVGASRIMGGKSLFAGLAHYGGAVLPAPALKPGQVHGGKRVALIAGQAGGANGDDLIDLRRIQNRIGAVGQFVVFLCAKDELHVRRHVDVRLIGVRVGEVCVYRIGYGDPLLVHILKEDLDVRESRVAVVILVLNAGYSDDFEGHFLDGCGGARLLSAVEKDIVPHGGAGQGQASDLDGLALARVGILKGAGGGDAQLVAAELAVQLYARVIKRRVGSLVIVFVLRRDAGDGDTLFRNRQCEGCFRTAVIGRSLGSGGDGDRTLGCRQDRHRAVSGHFRNVLIAAGVGDRTLNVGLLERVGEGGFAIHLVHGGGT